jgi:hypothetical protein
MQDYRVYRLNCIFCIIGLADFVLDKMSRRVNNVVEMKRTALLEFIVDSHYCMAVMTIGNFGTGGKSVGVLQYITVL